MLRHEGTQNGRVAGPSDIPVTGSLIIPAGELEWRFSRAGGPGGQGVNTTDSRVQLTWDVGRSSALSEAQRSRVVAALAERLVDGRVTVSSSAYREQLRNRGAAADRLADLVRRALSAPPPERRATRPTRGSQRRRIEGKRRTGETKRLRRRPDDG